MNHLRDQIIKSLKQHSEGSDSKDGMDVAVFVLDTKARQIEYAGANNPLYLLRNNELIETKGDKMPVAIYDIMHPFTKHTISVQENDVLYIFSDGYADQFGGPKEKKFRYKPFKQLLIDNQDKPMKEQKEILEKTFEDWKSYLDDNGKSYEQIDDILLMGVRIR
ncbi:MAG: SpoIIE family protein phosphatase [Bacteroidota bacterium]